jgi:hypothetical protein
MSKKPHKELVFIARFFSFLENRINHCLAYPNYKIATKKVSQTGKKSLYIHIYLKNPLTPSYLFS